MDFNALDGMHAKDKDVMEAANTHIANSLNDTETWVK